MPQRILVPLDGSPLAERALDEALKLARPDTTVVLLHVVALAESEIGEGPEMALDQQWETRKVEALQYLRKICERPEWKYIKTDVEVEMGAPADMIIDFARRHRMDLIVMSTHGRSGIQRWVYGSVADRVLHGADRTVVLVRARPQAVPRKHEVQADKAAEVVAR